jgi:phospholipase/carboxylesterase
MAGLDGPRWGPQSGGPARQLVVLCHGLGADGFDLIDLAPLWGKALPDALFLAPHAPQPCDLAPMGRQWFSVADRAPARAEAGVRAAAEALDGFLDAELARPGAPAEGYALMGFSQGAMTVLFAGLRRPVAPRAILAYSGGLIAPETLPAELRNRAPVLLVHGTDDDAVPIARSRLAEQALRQAAVPVETLWCPGLGHGIDAAGISIGGLALQRAFAG